MCLIVTEKKKDDSKFSFDDFDAAWEKNSDGFGMMWTSSDNRVHTYRALSKYKAKEKYKELKGKVDNLTIHFRLGTSGTKGIENVHPFKILDVDKDGIDLYMMHNGVIKTVDTHKQYCDTWHFATNYLRPILVANPQLLFDASINDLIENKAGYSKLTFLYSNAEYEGVHIINEKGGDWLEDTTWVSNKGYVKYVTPTPAYQSTNTFLNGRFAERMPDEELHELDEWRCLDYDELPTGSYTYVRGNHRRYSDGTMYYFNLKMQCWVWRLGLYDAEGYLISGTDTGQNCGGTDSLSNIFPCKDISPAKTETPAPTPAPQPEQQPANEDVPPEVDEEKEELKPEQLPLFQMPLSSMVPDYYKEMSKFIETIGYAETLEDVLTTIHSKKNAKLAGLFICELMLYNEGKALNDLYDFFHDNEAEIYDEGDDNIEIVGGIN